MSKVLRLLEDYGDLLTYRHEKWIEEEMKRQEESEDENGWDEEQDEWENEDDREFVADDIPF